MKMHCWGCGEVRNFKVYDHDEGPQCKSCGHFQESEAKGALEICEMATWHDLKEYERVASIARAGGFKVPDKPRYFQG